MNEEIKLMIKLMASVAEGQILALRQLQACKQIEDSKAEKTKSFKSFIRKQKMLLQHYMRIVREVKLNPEMFFYHTRMSLETFNELIQKITPYLKNHVSGLCIEQRLYITLSYLSTGESVFDIACNHKIDFDTCFKIVLEISNAIYLSLLCPYMKQPSTEDWILITNDFKINWNMPNCCGVIGSKCLPVKMSGCKIFSIMLTAVCDNNYRIRLLTSKLINYNNAEEAVSIFDFSTAMRQYECFIPKDTDRVGSSQVPYYFVGNKLYKLSNNLMIPYFEENLGNKEIIFNYKLSKLENVIENTFGIFFSRWQFLTKCASSDKVFMRHCISAAASLHNYLMDTRKCRTLYCPPGFVDKTSFDFRSDGAWRKILEFEFDDIESIKFELDDNNAKDIRNSLADYLCNSENITCIKENETMLLLQNKRIRLK